MLFHFWTNLKASWRPLVFYFGNNFKHSWEPRSYFWKNLINLSWLWWCFERIWKNLGSPLCFILERVGNIVKDSDVSFWKEFERILCAPIVLFLREFEAVLGARMMFHPVKESKRISGVPSVVSWKEFETLPSCFVFKGIWKNLRGL